VVGNRSLAVVPWAGSPGVAVTGVPVATVDVTESRVAGAAVAGFWRASAGGEVVASAPPRGALEGDGGLAVAGSSERAEAANRSTDADQASGVTYVDGRALPRIACEATRAFRRGQSSATAEEAR
jgi:hypothetical protein